MSLPFNEHLREIRKSKKDDLGRPLSQDKASRLFYVSLCTYQNWEASRTLPDARSMIKLKEIWPEIFS